MADRLHDGKPLPSGVYFKHGAFYRVVKNQWIRLGKDPACIKWPPYNLPRLGERKRELLLYAYKVLTRARNNAKGRRQIEFSLTRDDLHRLLNEAGWRCAVTGADFSMEVVNGARPFAPSIDRRDNSLGYLADNCRVVCVAANFAMNVWGEAVLWRLFSKRNGLRVLDDPTSLETSAGK